MHNYKKGVVIPFLHSKKDIKENRKLEKVIEIDEILSINDELLISMSHELKTPLNVIFGSAQLIEMSLTKDDYKGNVIKKNIDYIKQNCYRLTKLINNMVETYEINTGNLKLNVSKEDIVEVMRDIVQASTNLIEELGLKVSFNSNIDKKVIPFDKIKIERVLLNLLSNAIKFSKPGGDITVNIVSKDDFVEISVKDNGIGIEEKNLQNIFNKFGQVDKSLSRIAEGIGIGLFLVKSIVEMHGGSVSVQSKLGSGSEFIIRIPDKIYYEYSNESKVVIQEDDLIQIEFSDIPKAR